MEIDEVRKLLIEELADDLIQSKSFKILQETVLGIASCSDLNSQDDPEKLIDYIIENVVGEDIETQFLNDIYSHFYGYKQISSSETTYFPDEPDWIISGRIKWLRRVSKGLEKISVELKIPSVRKRSPEMAREFNRKWTEISTIQQNLEGIKPIYAPRELYEACKMCVEEANQGKENLPLGEMPAPVKLRTLEDARDLFWTAQTSVVYDKTNCIQARSILKGLKYNGEARGDLWKASLQVEPTSADRANYELLRRQVSEFEYVSDKLLLNDVRTNAGNDDFYFVFVDYILQCLMIFSRDDTNARISKLALEQTAAEDDERYPPSKVLPFYGFSFFVAPICFLFSDPVVLYAFFRKMYLRYFIRLHSIAEAPFHDPAYKYYEHSSGNTHFVDDLSSTSEAPELESADNRRIDHGIIGLAHQFEYFFKQRDPALFQHLHEINCKPVLMCFRWLVKGFSGVLHVSEVLRLWDFIVGHDSLEILSVFSVGVFLVRRQFLLGCGASVDAEAILSDLSTLKVKPVLELVFSGRFA